MEQKKILIVEDEADTREALGRYLERKGYQVFLAKEGEEAYGMARNVVPDLILTDVIMPQSDGNQLIKKIRESTFGKKIPIIVLTGRKNMKDYFDSLEINDFLVKPFSTEQISASIERVLASSAEVPVKAPGTKRILLAGRNNNDIERMAEQLREHGYHVDFVVFGDQLISKAVMFLPKVVILENEMHRLDPAQIIHMLRGMPQFKTIPVLIFSTPVKPGHEPSEELKVKISVDRCIERGATEYIGPYDKTVFLDKISKYTAGGSIVVVDDDEGIVRLIKVKAEAEGYKVFAAKEGEAGLELVRRIRPNLVLLDIVMPGVNGLDVLDSLKRDPELSSIPVIMITVKGSEDDMRKALALGADDYVAKPFYIGLLLKRIKSFVPIH